MTIEEYWNGDGVRVANEDGTITSYRDLDREMEFVLDNMEPGQIRDRELFGIALARAGRMLREQNRRLSL